ncbi:MAG: thioredoxin domain-containing protein [gamma proteobacterium symbiont of Bathyaustriella thionipta]|nr:thioredoxin domain-containing protein [gamma proteobacterium symbiont of Bathyaustriella thionipta]MCU7949952.1 thioredoxin domain-containing protein [gamma proteobacterium symbiont of Bathyaustriella thionipta]MCU7954694.1 thioredoxin domain-containing protein [gamma proteobacterium symbiont of Bathyaustriella thionipta]MCU7956517.1 thioredoxin domain-containing protein [gamma proteobacterium symbiont of Bathyaustriella thionipta]MCU7966835.1 thioredoxin domain-containing protein [gamma pro
MSFILFSSSPVFSLETPQTDNETIKWHEWSNDTFELAREENKLVLLDIGAQWCQFCKKMEAVTYKDPDVIKIINDHYIAIKADIEESGDVQMLYSSFGVPGTIILNADRDELNKRLGYIAPQQMQWHLLGNLQDAPDISLNQQ